MLGWLWKTVAHKTLPYFQGYGHFRDEQLYQAVRRLEDANKQGVLDQGYLDLVKEGELNGIKYWLQNQKDLDQRMRFIEGGRQEWKSGKGTTGRKRARRAK